MRGDPTATLLRGLAVLLVAVTALNLWASNRPAPPAPAATPRPSPARRGTDQVDIRYQDVLAGIVAMEEDPAVRLRPEQARTILAEIRSLSDNLVRLAQVQSRLNHELRKDQWEFVRDQRWEDLSHHGLQIPEPYSGWPDPDKTVGYSLHVVQALAEEQPEPSPAPRHSPDPSEELSWFHVSQAALYFREKRPELALTAAQARTMAPMMEDLLEVIQAVTRTEAFLLETLDGEQLDWMMEQKYARASRIKDGMPIIDAGDQPPLPVVVGVVERRAAE